VAEQIIIEFIADSSQLTPTIDALQKLGTIDAKAAEVFKKTNSELLKRTEVMAKVEQEERKQIKTLGDLEKAVASTAETFIQGFQEGVAESLATAGVSVMDLKKKLGLVNQDSPFMKLQKQIDEVNKRMLDTAAAMVRLKNTGGVDSERYKKLEKQLEADRVAASKLVQTMNEVRDSVDFKQAEEKSKSFRGRLRELREELSRMEEEGLEGTALFQKMAVEASKLEDQVGDTAARIRALASDTANTDAAIGAIQGITSAFGIAAGASALFGEENEDVQKTIAKLNAVILRDYILAKLESINATLPRIQLGFYL
jgi:ABC-type transporter Mla subunit MlaD